MYYIGNIITDSKLLNFDFYRKSSSIVNNEEPSLIIGWEKVKSIYPNVDILNKKINENTFWTFSKRERRNDYESDLDKFFDFTLDRIKKHINYKYFNIVLSSFRKKVNFIKLIDNDNKKLIYIENDFCYIYYRNMIIGFNIDDLVIFGINKDKIIERLFKNKKNIRVLNDLFIPKFIKKRIINDRMLVPYLASYKLQ